MGRRVYVPIHENRTNQLDSWIGKYTVRRMDASWMGVSSQQQRLAGETPPLCWGTSNEGCQAGRKICHAENQQHVVIQVVGQEGYPIYASVSRVATPPPPPPHMVWVQNLHFGYIFMEPAETHGIYNVLTSLASETVVFAAFCNTTLYTTTLIVLLLLLRRINPHSKSPHPPSHRGWRE